MGDCRTTRVLNERIVLWIYVPHTREHRTVSGLKRLMSRLDLILCAFVK